MKSASLLAGLGETYVRDILRGRTRPTVRNLQKLADAFGVPLSYLTGEEPESLRMMRGGIGKVKVKGRVAANAWLSVEDMDFGYDDEEWIPSASGYPEEWQFGLIVEGNCLNKIAHHGDRLVCLDVILASVSIKENDLVIVERSRFAGQMIERTAKRVRQAADGFELWPESTDPAHQHPIKLYQDTEDQVQVIGKVLWILRKP